jgi:magnesium-transporting ATPase (P-type)
MKIFFRNLGYALVLTIISFFINHALGFNTERHDIGDYSRNAVTVIFWCSIFLTVVQIRAVSGDEHNFLSAFRYGFFYSVFYSAAFALFMVFYQRVVNPQFYPTYRKFFEEQLNAAKLSPELIASRMRQFDMSFNGDFPTYVLLFLYMAMGGAILAAIAAAIFRNPVKHA